jgi:hypothetical protein
MGKAMAKGAGNGQSIPNFVTYIEMNMLNKKRGRCGRNKMGEDESDDHVSEDGEGNKEK